ncbi:hypothetical protein SGFS_065360 [Streptomyces graminofaciens]|uniref:Uncharacterized protein n=1 Tax=Streptomyces graminofaciens TaxID=68212 RepID=A0ABN5VQ40_9ACTN|nr:hypothetical protein [Streptomyces graminofaciens]BBC35242.1 hypothetical protein SGFS_065360 [Streptomyces graminofaciens]
MSTPLERLLAETIPVRPAPPPNRPQPAEPRPSPWTPAEQDAHWNALREAVGATREQRPTRLRLITPAA